MDEDYQTNTHPFGSLTQCFGGVNRRAVGNVNVFVLDVKELDVEVLDVEVLDVESA